ncbi:hypothetical protein Vwe01_60770 [Micromonospora andamanensis]|nr:hypothetical protein Vwe01_60770 [Micromonospora andamanensis]
MLGPPVPGRRIRRLRPTPSFRGAAFCGLARLGSREMRHVAVSDDFGWSGMRHVEWIKRVERTKRTERVGRIKQPASRVGQAVPQV